jgi:hypothetical protein
MSFVGKLLIVVQVVMSLCFMAFAGAVYVTHENWRTKFTDSEAALAASESAKSQIQADLALARDSLAKIEKDSLEEVNSWKLKTQMAETELAELRGEYDNQASELARQTALAEDKEKEAEFREKESEVLRSQNSELQKSLDLVTAELNVEKDKVFSAGVALTSLQGRFDKLSINHAYLEKVVTKYGLSTDPAEVAGMEAPAPYLDGVVEEIEKGKRGRTEFVVISVGTDDGLRVGHELDAVGVRNDAALFLGRIRVIDAKQDKAVCEVITPSRQGDIEVGDNVKTQL